MNKIGIILVNYNGADDTMECIRSIQKSTYNDYEIIVVDNCSTDSSYKCLQEYRKTHDFTLLQARFNNGFSAGNNVGIEYALKNGAEYVLLLNNDTVIQEDCIERLLEVYNNTQGCGAAIGKILYYSNQNIIWYAGGALSDKTARTEHFGYGQSDDENEKRIRKVTFGTGCCLLLSRKIIEHIGLLSEQFFLYEEDAEYSYRITNNGYDIIYVPSARIYHKVSASTGQGSPMCQYYTVRNKYIFIQECLKGMNKYYAYTYCTVQFLVRCLKRKMNFKYLYKGLKAFWKKERGRTDNY